MNSERNIIQRLSESKGDPDQLYHDYLDKHITGVRDVYENILKPILVSEGIPDDILRKISTNIIYHDEFKYKEEEWSAYRNYFYDKENHPRSSEEFNYAWLHHQNHSKHHWQYWVLINDKDNPPFQALDMPFEFIIEMLCDWASAGRHYGNTAYDWYEKQKHRMILSGKTKELIEKYIIYLKDL